MTTKTKTTQVQQPPLPPAAWPLNVDSDTLCGAALAQEKSRVSPVLALGDALARWEDAMLKQDYHAAANAAFDAAWLARECRLRRGDEGNELLQLELKLGFQLASPDEK